MQKMMLFFNEATKEIKRKDCRIIIENLKSIAEASIEKEKEFAEKCFEAGRKFQITVHFDKPMGFKQFYNQFESASKSV